MESCHLKWFEFHRFHPRCFFHIPVCLTIQTWVQWRALSSYTSVFLTHGSYKWRGERENRCEVWEMGVEESFTKRHLWKHSVWQAVPLLLPQLNILGAQTFPCLTGNIQMGFLTLEKIWAGWFSGTSLCGQSTFLDLADEAYSTSPSPLLVWLGADGPSPPLFLLLWDHYHYPEQHSSHVRELSHLVRKYIKHNVCIFSMCIHPPNEHLLNNTFTLWQMPCQPQVIKADCVTSLVYYKCNREMYNCKLQKILWEEHPQESKM